MKRVKYKVIPFNQIANEYTNSIGFISPEGDLVYIRKYGMKGAHHTEVASDILVGFNDQAEDYYMSCEKLMLDYGYIIAIDDYGYGKVSLRFYNDPTKRQLEVINKIYYDYVFICEKEDDINIISM